MHYINARRLSELFCDAGILAYQINTGIHEK